MKKLAIMGSSFVISLFPILSHAQQAVCKSNGVVVPCSDMVNGFLKFGGGLFGVFAVIWIFFVALSIAGTIFWILMLIHAATKNKDDKTVWIIVICLMNILGALVYYFVIKRPHDKAEKSSRPAPASTSPSQPASSNLTQKTFVPPSTTLQA